MTWAFVRLRSRRSRSALLAIGLVLVTGTMYIGGRPAAASTSSRFTASKTVTRSLVSANGKSRTIDRRTVSLSVSQTTNLRGRQEINVAWRGAHPTGATFADVNSGDAAGEEYPFVLLECRGTASTISPQTCWTQTWSERFQSNYSTGWPAWRSDRYASTAQRAALVNEPSPRPAACYSPAPAERWVPFKAVDGTVYPGGSVGCAGQAPESANVGGAGIPSNATYGITGKDGRGSAQFDAWTSEENASLGCTDTITCSLVAIPIEGTSCDAYGTQLPPADQPPATVQAQAETDCSATGQYAAGVPDNPGTPTDAAVTGALWWSASNWRNRITVPLQFATPASECAVVSKESPVDIYGSVLMSELSAQWEPTFCTDRALHPFVHVATSDASARTLLTVGSIDAAFTSRPPDPGTNFGRPVVQAPVAMTGFAVSFAVDDAKGNRVTSLNLDARLLAKLLTESYPGNSLVQANYPALAHNPMNITQDPEFIALNPGLPKYATLEAASTLSILSSDADLTYALTSYLNNDPEARSWLNGNPDPWGMTVNPNYQGIRLPLESWPLLDNFTLPQSYIDSQNNPCYSYSPAPYLQLIANPSATLAPIVQNLQFAISNADIACPNGVTGDPTTLKLAVQGRQQPGHRFVLGVTSISAARRYDLSTASLQTSLRHPDLSAQFTDATGRSFVDTGDAGLRAAAALLQRNAQQRTWTTDYAKLDSTAGAYPGAMPVYADVPTVGLPAASATALADFLTYASSTGQQPGGQNGELPAGYLPLTAGNGLGALANFTERAASAVAHQQGRLPSLTAPVATPTPTTSPSTAVPSTSTSSGGGTGATGTGAPGDTGGDLTGGATTAGTGPTTSPAATTSPQPSSTPVAAVEKPGSIGVSSSAAYSVLGSIVVPIAILLALIGGSVGMFLRYPAAGAVASGVALRARRGTVATLRRTRGASGASEGTSGTSRWGRRR